MLGGPAPPLLLEGSVLRVGDRIVLGRTSATTAVGGLTAMCMRQQQCWGGPALSLLLEVSVLRVGDSSSVRGNSATTAVGGLSATCRRQNSVGEDQCYHCCWRAHCYVYETAAVLGRTSAITAVGGLSAICMRQQQCWGGPAPSLLLDGSVLCVRDRSSVGEDQRHHCCWRAQCYLYETVAVLGRTSAITAVGGLGAICMRQ